MFCVYVQSLPQGNFFQNEQIIKGGTYKFL